MNDVDIDALIGGRRSGKGRLVVFLALVLVAAVIGAFLLLRPEESDVVTEPPESVEATAGQLSTTVVLSGSAVAERSADLSFEAAGAVVSVEAEGGQDVRAGDTLASLDDSDAQMRIETAQVQLRLAQLRLEALLADPAVSELASARQSIEAAESQVTGAEQALAQLTEPPSASDLASAEQAVANALRQLSTAEEALEQLSEPPSASDLASAEQAVADALRQLSTAEETLAELLADPSDTEVDSARSGVTAAEADLTSAASKATESWNDLQEANDEYCEHHRLSDTGRVICPTARPLSDEAVTVLHESLEGRSNNYQRRTNALINTNVAFVLAEAARESAVTALSMAEEHLSDLLAPASDDDTRQAELAVEAAQANHTAAAARLQELREEPTSQDFYQAEQAVEAAQASHAAAARLQELREEPTSQDFYQAEQAVEAARANHAAAAARLEELQAPPDESEMEQALASLESAIASLDSAQARYDELLAGETANAIAQQEQNVRLAEITLEEARADLSDLTLAAPFDGVVEAVNVHPGDRVSANEAAFSMSTTDRILIDLSVTEADLLALEIGQAGIATFDGIEDVEYPVRVVSISRLPNAAQGVVTYAVEARILTGAETAEVAGQIAALGSQGVAGALRALPDFGAGGGGFGGGGSPLAGIELPEGVTIRDVMRAVITDQPLPGGVVLPEDFEIPPHILQFIEGAASEGDGPQGPGAGGLLAPRVLPAPGMSASVTILTELREEAVLVPVAAVRQIDGQWFVAVPAAAPEGAETGFERVMVEVGESDGVNVEITGGLHAGATVLIGADSAGIAFSATQQQQQPNVGFVFPPGFSPPGFGGPAP